MIELTEKQKAQFEESIKSKTILSGQNEDYRVAFFYWANGFTQAEAKKDAKKDAKNKRNGYMIFMNGVYTSYLEELATKGLL